jgi:hypothetical protein
MAGGGGPNCMEIWAGSCFWVLHFFPSCLPEDFPSNLILPVVPVLNYQALLWCYASMIPHHCNGTLTLAYQNRRCMYTILDESFIHPTPTLLAACVDCEFCLTVSKPKPIEPCKITPNTAYISITQLIHEQVGIWIRCLLLTLFSNPSSYAGDTILCWD